jgi:hypothetical protein
MGDTIKVYLKPAFLICAIVLGTAGGFMSFAMKKLNVVIQKEPCPLRKSFDHLDENGLAQFSILAKHKIENTDIEEALGTEDYIQWIIEDSEAPHGSSVRRLMLFITYYDLPDQVPHVPEECYTGGGFQKLTSESVSFEINEGGLGEVEGRYLVFGRQGSGHWLKRDKFPVLYLFRVNDEYANSRGEARAILNKNIFYKFSYFCKIELVFNQGFMAPSKEDAVAASTKVLRVILPILEKEHWPVWKKD